MWLAALPVGMVSEKMVGENETEEQMCSGLTSLDHAHGKLRGSLIGTGDPLLGPALVA